jgi:hypothetical protein
VPSVSAKQHRLMAAVASNPAVAKKTKIPQSVGKEFMQADKGKKFKQGGVAAVKQDINFTKESGMASKMKFAAPTPMGKVKTAAPSKDGVAIKGKTKGKQVVMAGAAKGMKRGGKC